MKRFTFVYKLNISFNPNIRNQTVKLTQSKVNTEEIARSSGVELDTVMCFGMEVSLVLLFLLCYFKSTVHTFSAIFICFHILMIIRRKGFLLYDNIGNRYVNVAC